MTPLWPAAGVAICSRKGSLHEKPRVAQSAHRRSDYLRNGSIRHVGGHHHSSEAGSVIQISKNRGSDLREKSFSDYMLHEDILTGEFSLHPSSKTESHRGLEKHILATLSGIGSLHSSTGEVGAVRCHLSVWQAYGTQVGEGLIWGDEKLLHQTYIDSDHRLQIADGRSIPILLTDWDSNSAEFRTTGPIPGIETSLAKARDGVMV